MSRASHRLLLHFFSALIPYEPKFQHAICTLGCYRFSPRRLIEGSLDPSGEELNIELDPDRASSRDRLIENRLANLYSARRIEEIVSWLMPLINIVREAFTSPANRVLPDYRIVDILHINWDRLAEASAFHTVRNRRMEIIRAQADDHYFFGMVYSMLVILNKWMPPWRNRDRLSSRNGGSKLVSC